MDDTVHLGDSSQWPANGVPISLDCDLLAEFLDDHVPASFAPVPSRGGLRPRGRSNSGRSTSVSSQSEATLSHKVRGPNWTEAEMLILIGQKRLEWNGRHNCNQPALAKFVYGTTAWKLVLAGCMNVVGFRARDTDQITNKWDGLMKDYKKLKEYIEGTGSANWWGMSRDEKKCYQRLGKCLWSLVRPCMRRWRVLWEGVAFLDGHWMSLIPTDPLHRCQGMEATLILRHVHRLLLVRRVQLLVPRLHPTLLPRQHREMTHPVRPGGSGRQWGPTTWWISSRTSTTSIWHVWRLKIVRNAHGGQMYSHSTPQGRQGLRKRNRKRQAWNINFMSWKLKEQKTLEA